LIDNKFGKLHTWLVYNPIKPHLQQTVWLRSLQWPAASMCSWAAASSALCFLLFVGIMVAKCYDFYSTRNATTTTTRLVPLADLPFPLDIDVTLVPGFNQQALAEHGYASAMAYFLGTSIYNESVHGWSGHTENGSNFGNPKGKMIILTTCKT
jgi:hypothetical protein